MTVRSSGNRTAANQDVAYFCVASAAGANACTTRVVTYATISRNRTSLNGNRATDRSACATSDACSIFATLGCNRAATNQDITAINAE